MALAPITSQPILVCQAAQPGCLISNGTIAPIYLSRTSAVSPTSYDIRIGGLQAVQWDGGQLWGCTDIGAQSAFTILAGGSAATSGDGIAAAIYGTGSRSVDAPVVSTVVLNGPSATSAVFDVTQSLSVDILWSFRSSATSAALTLGQHAWGALVLMWADANGQALSRESYELAAEGNPPFFVTSRSGVIRTPAQGAQLSVLFTGRSGDIATLRVVLSSRSTDRTRYYSNGSLPALQNILLPYQPVTIPANGYSPPLLVDVCSAPVQLSFVAQQAVQFLVGYGSTWDTNQYATAFPLTAGVSQLALIYAPRTHLVVRFQNNAASAVTGFVVATASDT